MRLAPLPLVGNFATFPLPFKSKYTTTINN